MAEFAGYQVAIYGRGDTLACDAKKFPFGEWQEIGFWLDENGYNQHRYIVHITFTDERD